MLDVACSKHYFRRRTGIWEHNVGHITLPFEAVLSAQLPLARSCMDAGLPETVPGVPFQTVDGESFLMFGMSPSEGQYPVYLYEELIEPKLGAGDPVLRNQC